MLQAIWPYSDHYLPTEENFREFICFLEESHVDLTNVKRCSVDDDDASVGFSFKVPENTENEIKPKPLVIPHPRPVDILRTPTRVERPSTSTVDAPRPVSASRVEDIKSSPIRYSLANRLSCKWTSGNGP
ncbi:hypothetical protein OSB04_020893 [Centaurea solstitialis]|uniref:Uncharacterized protein n=1 Tax=Centaurea solstitialis TaxID=347529 RepID=A0AA38T594_9ASTR|nr:hypothetical protein OSB04_020893 [Centaurea solstitialis]